MKITLQSYAPIAHGAFGESAGNATPIRRMRLVSAPGMPRVPVVSGNSLRGQMRRLIMRDLFARANLSRETMPSAQWDRLYAALANGGHLEGEGSSSANPDTIREMRVALPPLSLFGAALYSWMLPGHMTVGILWPRCRETWLGKVSHVESQISAEDLVEEISLVRHIDREMQDPDVSGVTPMPTTIECLAPGTILDTEIQFAPSATPIEKAVAAHAVRMIRAIGGKSGAGFGVVSVTDPPDDSPYLDWLADTPDLEQRLRDLAATLVRSEKVKAAKMKKEEA